MLALAGALGAATFTYIWSDMQERRAKEFSKLAQAEVRAVSSVLGRDAIALESTETMLEVTGEISRDDFALCVHQQLERYDEIQALEWGPRASGESASGFPTKAQEAGFPGFSITERDTYYPVFFIEPDVMHQVRVYQVLLGL